MMENLPINHEDKENYYNGSNAQMRKALLAAMNRQSTSAAQSNTESNTSINGMFANKGILTDTKAEPKNTINLYLNKTMMPTNSCAEMADALKRMEDVFYVKEYQEDINNYLRDIEKSNRPHPNFIIDQKLITFKMRSTLVDWLVAVANKYCTNNNTLHVTVLLLDKTLSLMNVEKEILQLVGTVALLIAQKYVEHVTPPIEEFIYITNDLYTIGQFREMEQLILKAIQFNLSSPTTMTFMELYSDPDVVKEKEGFLSLFFSELMLLKIEKFLTYPPSQVAASCIALARYTLSEKVIWPKSLQLKTEYSLFRLSPIIMKLDNIYQDSNKMPLNAIYKKFSSGKFKNVAFIPPRTFDLKALFNIV